MRTALILSLLAPLAAPAYAQDAPTRIRVAIRELVDSAVVGGAAFQRQESNQETERTTRTFRLGANGELLLANVSGDITITRGGGGETTVEIVKTARSRSNDDARELLKLVDVEVVERGTRAELRARYPQGEEMRRHNRRNINVSVAFNVTVPQGTRVRANSVSGSVSAKDVKGELDLESVSGGIRIANGGRIASAKSISGEVEVIDSDIDGALSASSVSGGIVMRRIKARQLDVGSISGDVLLEDVDASRVEGQTVSGNVRFRGPLARSGRYELNSHSGEIEVGVSGGGGFEVEATSFSGTTRSDFPFTTGGDEPRYGRRNRTIRGVYGDGSSILELTTFSGNIVILKR